VETSFALGAAIMLAGGVAILGAASALAGGPRALVVAGGVAGVLAFGYGVGAVLAAASLVLLLRLPPAARAPLGPALRRAGIHLAHLGLAVGLLGYAAATYARDDVSLTLAPGETGEVGGLALTYDRTEAVAWPDGASERLRAVLVLPDGDEAGATFFWKGTPVDHYDPLLDVRRGWWRDVYVAPKAFHVEGVGTVREHTSPSLEDMPRFAPENVRAVSFDVVVLPLMAFVWGGLWLLLGAMTLVVVGGASDERAKDDGRRAEG